MIALKTVEVSESLFSDPEDNRFNRKRQSTAVILTNLRKIFRKARIFVESVQTIWGFKGERSCKTGRLSTRSPGISRGGTILRRRPASHNGVKELSKMIPPDRDKVAENK